MKKNIFFEDFRLSNFDNESDFFPLLSSVDEEKISREEVPESLAILPLRNTVLFPGVIIPITVGRDKSVKALEDAIAQQDPTTSMQIIQSAMAL